MSKYQSTRKKVKERTNQPHYAWRGIGCVMMILIPIISYAAAVETIKFAVSNGMAVPYDLMGYPRLPALFYQSSGLMMILGPITRIQNLYAYLLVAVFYTILLGAIMSMVYAIFYRMSRPSQYGPLDAPPPKVKVKPYKR